MALDSVESPFISILTWAQPSHAPIWSLIKSTSPVEQNPATWIPFMYACGPRPHESFLCTSAEIRSSKGLETSIQATACHVGFSVAWYLMNLPLYAWQNALFILIWLVVYLSIYVGIAGEVEWSAEISVDASNPTRIRISSFLALGVIHLPSISCGSQIGVSTKGRSYFLWASSCLLHWQ